MPGEDPNDHAVVLLASYGEVDVLLTADAESDVTAPLSAAGRDPQGRAPRLGRPGSRPPSCSSSGPRVAVISVGADNDYGHPTAVDARRARAVAGLAVYRTDQDGRVVRRVRRPRAVRSGRER